MLNAFRANAINVAGSGITGQAGEELLKAVPRAQAYWILVDRNPAEIGLNTSAEPFGDRRVRQAISKAVDRKAMIKSIFAGHAILSAGLIVPTADFRLPEAELDRLLARDVEGARRLLREAGKEAGFEKE